MSVDRCARRTHSVQHSSTATTTGPAEPHRGASGRNLLLVRHPQVDHRYRGVCYGRSDIPLSLEGQRQSRSLAQELARLPVRRIIHSGLQRTEMLAGALAELTGCPATAERAIAERDFGDWELETWDEIYRREGEAMLKMVSEPDRFRPGGGETTLELAERVWNWYRGLPTDGLTVAVTHGGPIAACLGRQRQLAVGEWLQLVPACGTLVWTETWHSRGEVRV